MDYHLMQDADGAVSGSDMIDELTDQLQELVRDASILQRMKKDIGTPRDTPSLRNELKLQKDKVMQLQRSCQKMLQTRVDPSLKPKQDRLKEQFKDISGKVQQLLKLVTQDEQRVVERDEETGATQEESSMYEENQRKLQQQNQIVNVDEMRVELYDHIEKNKEVKELETDVVELSEAFVDLNKIVHEQQEGLDLMENNVDATLYNVEDGVKNLEKANKWQKRSRWKLFVLLILIIIVFIIIILIMSGAGTVIGGYLVALRAQGNSFFKL